MEAAGRSICLACGARFDMARPDLSSWTCPSCGQYPEIHDGFLTFAPTLAHENEGFAEDDFARLATVEADSFWFRSRNRLIAWAVQTYFPTAQSFLEIGCGTAFVLSGIRHAFPHLRLAGSEIFTRGLGFARERLPDVPLFQMDARQIPFEGAFDVIGAFDVLEHVNEDEQILAQLHQAVKPGGGIIVSVPQHPLLWNIVDEFSHHKRRYTRGDLVAKVRRAGFRVRCATSFMSLLLPVLLLSRLRQPKSVEQFDPMSEVRIGRLANTLLEQVMTVERQLIRQGISLPAGGSLLLVAERTDLS